MSRPGWEDIRADVPSKRNTGYRNEGAGVVHDETERRKFEAAAAAAQVQSGGGGGGGGAAAAVAKQTVAAPDLGPDRLHKESISADGGYIYVSHDHNEIEGDQLPPTNPAYRGAGVAVSSMADALSFAVTRQSLLRPGARIVIMPIGGRWSLATGETPMTINTPGIDIIGHGRPSLDMGITVGPTGDTSFRDLDIAAPNVIGLQLLPALPPLDMNPQRAATELTGCRIFSEGTGFYSQRRFYAEASTFEQTSSIHGLDEAWPAIRVEMMPPQSGASLMKDCTIKSFYTEPDIAIGDSLGGPLDRHPGGYAIFARALAAGPYKVNLPTLAFFWSSPILVLEDCAVYGSLFCDEWSVQHIGGHVHGAYPVGNRSGTIYAILRGRPLFDPINGFYANVPACVSLDNTGIYAEQVAKVVAWNGAYPVGVVPSVYPGQGYVQLSDSPHFCRFDGGAGTAFNGGPGMGIGVADVVNSSTGAAAWISANWNVVTYGSCPFNVVGNRRFYLM